jgi:hypothetical protein
MCSHKPFDEVWKDIQVALSNKNSVETLVQKVRNNVISIERDHIKVKSEKTGKIRKVPRSQFEHVWNILATNGYYVSRDHQPYIHSQIICAILSLLNYIEVSYNPLTLHLKSPTK